MKLTSNRRDFFKKMVAASAITALPMACTKNILDEFEDKDEKNGTFKQGNQKEILILDQLDFDANKNRIFEPGDRILFKRGVSFKGMFAPRGSGTKENPIVIGAFGEGDMPLIENGGVLYDLEPERPISAGLFLYNLEYISISDLQITNNNGTEQIEDTYGIYILAEDTGKVHNSIHVENCYIHHVNLVKAKGVENAKDRGAIHIWAKAPNTDNCPSYHDLRIVGNRMEHFGGVGIATRGDRDYIVRGNEHDRSGLRDNAWTDMVVAHNTIRDCGRNGIIIRDTDFTVVEYNRIENNGQAEKGHSIYNSNTWGIKIQFNEVSGNRGTESDRGAFDADVNTLDTYIQYNYSHENQWFCGIMKRNVKSVYIHHNVSINEFAGAYFYGFDGATAVEDVHIYNNTHIYNEGTREIFVKGRTPRGTTLVNNIFYFGIRGGAGEAAEPGPDVTFDNNLYFNMNTLHSSEKNAIIEKPLFASPLLNSVPSDIDLDTMEAISGFRLAEGSPGIDQGKPVTIPGLEEVTDLWRQNFPNGLPDCGAAEFYGMSTGIG